MRQVVAPTALAGKLADRHEFDRRHAQIAQLVEPSDQRVEGPLGRECADVQLIDHEFGARQTLPSPFGPVESVEANDRRRAMHAVRLPARRRIGSRGSAIDRERVTLSLGDVFFPMNEVAARLGLHGDFAESSLARESIGQQQFDLASAGSPNSPAD